ncbi:hypothetical protein V1290_004678 [Bradyrhizobium sp. AZCC 1578]|uniref:DUF2513 domain-containing protein n=1 Tax=Bradyrhizobium sp. AZCC 1578 TaxID=3117027 RepID=UPI002FF011ED
MKRDMEYVRELLLKIEAAPDVIAHSPELLPANSTLQDKIKLNYHLGMLIDETGFVSGIAAHTMAEPSWIRLQLTWHGHEFIETVRDPEVWKRTKEGASKAGNFGLEFVIEIAKAYGKHVAKERLGIDL